MPTDPFSSREEAPPFIKPFLEALDRMREQEVRSPDELKRHAHGLLSAHLGASTQAVEEVFAQGAVSLLSDHTHYSDGFAVLMPVRQGTAVAIRRAEKRPSRVVFEGNETVWSLEDEATADAPLWVRVVDQAVAELGPATEAVEMAIVSTIPSSCLDAYLSALSVAAARALFAYGGTQGEQGEKEVEARLPALRRILAACTALPFSIAFPIASCAGGTDTFTLVDTATHEHLPVETTARSALGWSLIDPKARPRDAAFHHRRRDQAEEALAILQRDEFKNLTSFRELEHRDLPRALDALPAHLAAVARHLVTENRRVQKLVAAMRRNDWQMVGALLLMSHASRRDEWGSTSSAADFLVEQVESLTLDGIYGACMTGRGGYVVLVSQPHTMMLGLDRLTATFEQRFEYAPDAMVL